MSLKEQRCFFQSAGWQHSAILLVQRWLRDEALVFCKLNFDFQAEPFLKS